jgi:hypothetical protein
MQISVLVNIERIVFIDDHVVDLLLNTPIILKIRQQTPHDATHCGRCCVGSCYDSYDCVSGQTFKQFFFFFKTSLISLNETGRLRTY